MLANYATMDVAHSRTRKQLHHPQLTMEATCASAADDVRIM
jgi:hypothetical protein